MFFWIEDFLTSQRAENPFQINVRLDFRIEEGKVYLKCITFEKKKRRTYEMIPEVKNVCTEIKSALK